MWSRALLKERGRAAFKANYWRCVFVALVLLIAAGTNPVDRFFNSVAGGVNAFVSSVERLESPDYQGQYSDYDSFKTGVDSYTENLNIDDFDDIDGFTDDIDSLDTLSEEAFLSMLLIILAIVLLVVMALSFALGALLLWPLEVGCRKFFLNNSDRKCEDPGLIAFAFDNNYSNIAKVQLFKNLYIFLWGLLLIVPGIIKQYEYYLVPYLLAENPDMDTRDALETSKLLMYGHKFNTFVMNLSFLGWRLLSILFTFGLLGIFYVNPYVHATDAELYKVLSGKASGMPQDEPLAAYGNGGVRHNPENEPQSDIIEEDVIVNFEEPVE